MNFYSTGDEALELVPESGIMVWSGLYTNGWDVAHHCWHKQEMFKGRAHLTRGLGGTNWAGWGFNTNLFGLALQSKKCNNILAFLPSVRDVSVMGFMSGGMGIGTVSEFFAITSEV